ncbi:uncharacterized protein LOC129592696 isoform X2 [Paramacrobiotus metropolitanus]|nr:uncharacterized protein LOC129592696 isoform X2 [Paramacrobiotus metropolitanus]
MCKKDKEKRRSASSRTPTRGASVRQSDSELSEDSEHSKNTSHHGTDRRQTKTWFCPYCDKSIGKGRRSNVVRHVLGGHRNNKYPCVIWRNGLRDPSDRQDYLHGRLPKKCLYYRLYQDEAMTKLGGRIDGVWEVSEKKHAIELHPIDLKEGTKLRKNAQHRQNIQAYENSSQSSELPMPLTSAKRSTGTKSAASRKRRFSSSSTDRLDPEDPKEGIKLRNDRQYRNSVPVSEISSGSSELPVPITQRAAVTKPTSRKRRFSSTSSDRLDLAGRSSPVAGTSTPGLPEKNISAFSKDLYDSGRGSTTPGDTFLVTVYNADGTAAAQVTVRGTFPPKITVAKKSAGIQIQSEWETEGAVHYTPGRSTEQDEAVVGFRSRKQTKTSSEAPPRDRSLDRAVSYLMSL